MAESRRLACIVDDFRAIARQYGYALAEHGSKARDYDLVACPWTKHAKAATTLVRALADVVGVRLVCRSLSTAAILAEGRRPKKPHGRLGYVFHLTPADPDRKPWYIDLSVMPRFA